MENCVYDCWGAPQLIKLVGFLSDEIGERGDLNFEKNKLYNYYKVRNSNVFIVFGPFFIEEERGSRKFWSEAVLGIFSSEEAP